MNRYADDRPTEHADDAQRLLERLREVGDEGITTGELIREGCCGLRPPNRVMDLRRAGHVIETIREGGGVFRYRLVRENSDPSPGPSLPKTEQLSFADSDDWYERQTGKPRPSAKPPQEDVDDLPLFAKVLP